MQTWHRAHGAPRRELARANALGLCRRRPRSSVSLGGGCSGKETIVFKVAPLLCAASTKATGLWGETRRVCSNATATTRTIVKLPVRPELRSLQTPELAAGRRAGARNTRKCARALQLVSPFDRFGAASRQRLRAWNELRRLAYSPAECPVARRTGASGSTSE